MAKKQAILDEIEKGSEITNMDIDVDKKELHITLVAAKRPAQREPTTTIGGGVTALPPGVPSTSSCSSVGSSLHLLRNDPNGSATNSALMGSDRQNFKSISQKLEESYSEAEAKDILFSTEYLGDEIRHLEGTVETVELPVVTCLPSTSNQALLAMTEMPSVSSDKNTTQCASATNATEQIEDESVIPSTSAQILPVPESEIENLADIIALKGIESNESTKSWRRERKLLFEFLAKFSLTTCYE